MNNIKKQNTNPLTGREYRFVVVSVNIAPQSPFHLARSPEPSQS
ncbi:MAG TPA: hypothetical protein PLV51_08885 [Lentimicrobium sp.]|nr:hypothetical protein [Lentimicrobium sp.]